MNGNYPVKDATKKKIQETIEFLNYSPNVLARGLIGSKTYTIGIIVPSLENLFFSEVIRGIDEVLIEMDYTTFICSTNEDYSIERKHILNLLDRKVDGIISISPDMKSIGKYYEEISKTTPVIIINGEQEGYDCHFVSSDQVTGTKKAIEYLIYEGHKKIAFLRGHDIFAYNLKEKIYKELLAEKNLQLDEELIIRIKEGNSISTVDESKKKIREVLEKRKDITAIFACNDLMAVGALNACLEIGINVPKDCRVIGFDNTLICSLTWPKLSTVEQNMKLLGITAAKKIMKLIDGGDDNFQKKIIMETSLLIRET